MIAGTVVTDHDIDDATISSLDDAALIGELVRRLDQSTANILAAARVLRACDERGIDTSHIEHPLLETIRKIAYGEILPGLLTHMIDRWSLSRLPKLPVTDQKRIVDGEPLALADGRKVPFEKMNRAERKRVVGNGHLRSTEQQRQEIAKPAPVPVPVAEPEPEPQIEPAPSPAGRGKIQVDRKRGVIVFNGAPYGFAEVLAALLYCGGLAFDPMTVSERLKECAKRAKCSEAEYLRKALQSCGLV